MSGPERMTPIVRDLHAEYPELSTVADTPVGPERATQAMAVALRDLHKAQLDVLYRVYLRLNAPGPTAVSRPAPVRCARP